MWRGTILLQVTNHNQEKVINSKEKATKSSHLRGSRKQSSVWMVLYQNEYLFFFVDKYGENLWLVVSQ